MEKRIANSHPLNALDGFRFKVHVFLEVFISFFKLMQVAELEESKKP